MRTEKPAPGGASFSEKSIESRQPKDTARDTAHQARKRALLASTRCDCIHIIRRLVGEGGVQPFLTSQQPALGDRTGAQLLQNDPEELLRCLKWLDAGDDGFDDELVGDPGIEDFGRQRGKSQADRVFEILDELGRHGHD
jgi:hypothetical protein